VNFLRRLAIASAERMAGIRRPRYASGRRGRGRGAARGARVALTLLACGAHALRPTIPIVAEGPDYLVVHKPAGVPCHRRDDQPGILELVDSAEDLKLAHRLDDGTSGCLVLAKGRRAAAACVEINQCVGCTR
jgi:23S rRNA-/tRNA-specific pseudouridylate synthase